MKTSPSLTLSLSLPVLLSIKKMVAFPACRQLFPPGLLTDGKTLVHAHECKCANKLFSARPLMCPSIHLSV